MVIALLHESLQTDDTVSLNVSLAPSEWEFYEALWQERAWMVRRVDRIVVTHSGTTRVILRYLCGATAGERTRIYIGNGGIVRLWTNKKTANITIDQVYNLKQKG